MQGERRAPGDKPVWVLWQDPSLQGEQRAPGWEARAVCVTPLHWEASERTQSQQCGLGSSETRVARRRRGNELLRHSTLHRGALWTLRAENKFGVIPEVTEPLNSRPDV